jgi:transposase
VHRAAGGCDGLGRPLRLRLTPGQAADISSAPILLAGIQGRGLIAGRASDALRTLLALGRMEAVIPAKSNRKVAIPHERFVYRTRNRIERCFNKLKHFRRIATRFDRRDTYFRAFLHLACALLWLR